MGLDSVFSLTPVTYIGTLTSSGQRSRAPWASEPQKSATLSPQPGGKPRTFIKTCGGIGKNCCPSAVVGIRRLAVPRR